MTVPQTHGHPHRHEAVSASVDPKPNDYRSERLSAAYLHHDLMEAAGVNVGGVIRITTTRGRNALVRIEGSHPEELVGTIRFDRFTRQSLKVYPHEPVSIEPVSPQPASRLVLVPAIDISTLNIESIRKQAKAQLSRDRALLWEGALLYLKAPGATAGITYEVHSVPEVEAVFTEETTLYLELTADHTHDDGSHQHEDSSHSGSRAVLDITYEDVGGLQEQLREVREFVELPLLFPQVYRQLGMHPPRGVIFYGSPGTGKTLLARSVANEVNAHFYYINGPEIVGSYSGETEDNLRKVFREASATPPSIIFVDELDAIAPRRNKTSASSDARAVAQLLSLMDGLQRGESVIVIGTTNRLESIDPALRRAGRFDREVHFPPPSAQSREQILRVHTREMPLADDAVKALPEIAQQAYGYVGADVMELTREAGLNALRRASRRFIESPSLATYPAPDDLIITRADFESALATLRPASLRESLMSVPVVKWDDVGGLGIVKERLRDLIEAPLRYPEAIAQLGLSTIGGVLLHGPSGTGKTLLARAIASECGGNFIAIQGPEMLSQWIGESEESIRYIFDVARRAAPCLVFFDQLDAIAANRTEAEREGTRAPQRLVSQLLAELDGLEERAQVVVIGATNHLSMVDPAVLRPGRFGMHLYVGLPSEAERGEILRIHLRSATLAPSLDIDTLIAHLAPLTDGLSGADIAFLCQHAKLDALRAAGYRGEPSLALHHFDRVLSEISERPTVRGKE